MNPVQLLKNTYGHKRRRLTEKLIGKTPLPGFVSIELTYDCPSSCRTCNLWTPEFRAARVGGCEKLSTEQWRSIIRNLSGCGVRYAMICGGEPFVYSGIFEIFKELKTAGITFTSFTNGLLITQDRAEGIVASGLDTLAISLDGSTAAVHDAVRGTPGSFEKTTTAIRMISRLKKLYGADSPRIALSTTISSMNLADIVNIPALAAKLGAASLGFHLYSTVDTAVMDATNKKLGEKGVTFHSFSHLPRDLMLSEKQLDVLVSLSPKLKANANGVAVSFDPLIMKTKKELLKYGSFAIKRCNYFWNNAIISPYGDMFPCPMLPEYFMGNLLLESLDTIWNNDRYQHIRETIRTKMLPICCKCCAR
jgi:MoaA/NifB/PqqE/SkfB family radical SAM enzyme